MVLKWFLAKMDQTLCSYFGLKEEETNSIAVQMVKDRLLVTNTCSHKRHLMKESWDNFSLFGMKQLSLENREKLGLAAGKAIAKNLVVSFEEPSLSENLNNAER